MSAEYTPTTEDVRNEYTDFDIYPADEFDRWLAAHDAEVAARALRHAVPLAVGSDGYAIRQRLLARADRIEEGVA